MEDDQCLIRRFRARDTLGFEVFWNRHSPALFRFLLRLVGDRQISEDIVQETGITFAELVTRDEYYGDNPKGLLFSIAFNKAKHHFRDSKRREAFLQNYAHMVVSEVESQLGSDGWDPEKFEQQKQNLSPEDLELLHMRYLQGLKYRQISMVTGQSISTIESKLQRLCSRLRHDSSAAGMDGTHE